MKQHAFIVRELTMRELRRKYARSALGILWSVLNPLLSMAVLSLIFSGMFRRSIENYPIYYLCGYLIWQMFTAATMASISVFADNRALLLKVQLSPELFLIARVMTAFVNLLFSLIAFAAVLIVFAIPFHAGMLMIPLIFVLLLATSSLVPPIHNLLAAVKSDVVIYSGQGASPYTFSWVNTPGVLIFIAAFVGGALQKASLKVMGQVLWATLKQMSKTIITLVSILAAAKIMGYCGMTSDIAAFLVAVTGSAYPIVAPLIGSIGTFVTGSATSASVLFSGLQAETASALGMDAVWLVAANTIGATAGKIISPQSISIATAATNTVGQESTILRKSIGYYILFVVVFGLIALLAHPLAALVL